MSISTGMEIEGNVRGRGEIVGREPRSERGLGKEREDGEREGRREAVGRDRSDIRWTSDKTLTSAISSSSGFCN